MGFWDFLKPKPPEKFKIRIDVPTHVIYIVSDPSQYRHFKPRAKKKRGYFIKQGKDGISEVWILARKKKGKIVPKDGYRILGHEYWHFMDYLDSTELISNPDKIYVPEE